MVHTQINSAISSALSEKVITEIRNIVSSVSAGHCDTESGSSMNNQDNREEAIGLKTKITKKDSRSAFDLRDTEDLSPCKP